jgi:hypothetical protein
MFAPIRMMPIDMNTPTTLKKLSSVGTGICEYEGAMKAANVDNKTRMTKPLSDSKMLAIISERWPIVVMVPSKLLAVPTNKEKKVRAVIP